MDSLEAFLQENIGFEVRKSIEFSFSISGTLLPRWAKILRHFRPDGRKFLDTVAQTGESPSVFSSPWAKRSRTADHRSYVTLACKHGGAIKKYTKPIVDDEEEEIPIKRRGPYGTKKCGCPFKLKGEQMAISKNWQLFVHNGRHNHKRAIYHHGHAQAARLTKEQLQQTE
ncbi:hypothetical protein M9H77_31222 [Catharanthus roseus]|uniref:Uncharacterized protein n=1 Tax=Catharanthus roseus TaxID=4058 RepID=A0ACC0A1B2_CATRO|nr:hypothetical protein M9H77_31222 [Catharanthus roseus]